MTLILNFLDFAETVCVFAVFGVCFVEPNGVLFGSDSDHFNEIDDLRP